ncbi:MAG TPA: tetratricopeptide repeat protein, partial [Anaerolineae bacterium]
QQSLALLKQLALARVDVRREKAFALDIMAFWFENLDQQRARQLYEQCLTIYRELGDQWGIAKSLAELGSLDWVSGNVASALDRVQVALTIQQERGDWREQANSMDILGLIHRHLGHLDEAERLHREALSLSQRIGDRPLLVELTVNLANALLWQGKFVEAHQLTRESLMVCRDLGQQIFEEGYVYTTTCALLLHTGQYQQARQQAAYALSFLGEDVNRQDEGLVHFVLGQLALVEFAFLKAQAAFAESLTIFRKVQQNHMEISLGGLGYVAYHLGQPQRAREHLIETLSRALPIKLYQPVLFGMPCVALLLATTGDVTRAVEVWALATCHPFVANSKWFEDVAGRELETLAASLPPEIAEAAQERGRALDLWETAAALLTELEG